MPGLWLIDVRRILLNFLFIYLAVPQKPQIDPPEQTVDKGHSARVRCWVPNYPQTHLRWYRRGGGALPEGAHDDGRGNLYIQQTETIHKGDYECRAMDPQNPHASPVISDLARILLSPRKSFNKYFLVLVKIFF